MPALMVRLGYPKLTPPSPEDLKVFVQGDMMPAYGFHSFSVDRNIPVAMRDGINLSTDLYKPGGRGPFPGLLMRTPYGRDRNITVNVAERAVSHGYLVAIQEIRGRYASEGVFCPGSCNLNNHDPADGYDSVEWLASLPCCSGKVGTFGISYSSFVQWALATARPPHLVAMFASGNSADTLDRLLSGVFRTGRILWWMINTIAPETRVRYPEFSGPRYVEEAERIWQTLDRDKWLWYLPLSEIPDDVLAGTKPHYLNWLQNITTDFFGFKEKHSQINVPVYSLTGWYDNQIGTIQHYTGMVRNGMTAHARENQKLIIGPWTHTHDSGRKVGDVDFGPTAEFDFVALAMRWFDHWLKGVNNGIMDEPPIRIFVMGENCWREEHEWPLARTKYLSYYLHSKGHANTARGDGRLSPIEPDDEPPDSYIYDPRDPIMTLYNDKLQDVPCDHRAHDDRHDNLIFVSDPLQESLEITGPVTIKLWASASTPDTDFVGRLIDVYPDGFAHPLCYGIIRARYRLSMEKPSLLVPNQVYEFTLTLQPTSNLFQPGHRIRLDLSSSDFPNFDRNHNTGGDDYNSVELKAVKVTIFHNSQRPSHVILPVIHR